MKEGSPRHNKIYDLINQIKNEDKVAVDLDVIIKDIFREISMPTFEELWIDDSDEFCPISYWLYLANDINNDQEANTLKQLLFWKEFSGKSISRLKCLQIADTYFYNLCAKKFKPKFLPSLIVSDSPFFMDFIEINSDILLRIDNNKIIGFLNSIHREISIGLPIINVKEYVRHNLHNFQFDFDIVKTLISEGKLFNAFESVESSLNLAQDSRNEMILFKSQFFDIEDNRIKGIISNEEYNRSKSQLIDRFLNFIEKLKNKKLAEPRTAANLL